MNEVTKLALKFIENNYDDIDFKLVESITSKKQILKEIKEEEIERLSQLTPIKE